MKRVIALAALAIAATACSESANPTAPDANNVTPRADFAAASLGSSYDFEGDFGATASPFLPLRTGVIPANDYSRGGKGFLGKFTNNTVTMSTDYVNGGYLNLDLYIEGTWDGLSPSRFGQDRWRISAYCGTEATGSPAASFMTSFSNKYTTKQNYPDRFGGAEHPGRTTAINVNALGFSPAQVRTTNNAVSAYDAVYPMSFPFPASCAGAGVVTWAFDSSGLQETFDEFWGMDNISITASPQGGNRVHSW